jgi:hypothetical protein
VLSADVLFTAGASEKTALPNGKPKEQNENGPNANKYQND